MQALVFEEEGDTRFVRIIAEQGSMSYQSKSNDVQTEEYIIILKYYTEEFGLSYKMVLSE